MTKILTYENGLRVAVCRVPGVRSVASGFWIGVGSGYENAANNGISHFTEHVNFKGTDKYSAFDISNRFEHFGANFNAFTGKECTCYYVKSVDEYSDGCFELLSDLVLDSVFPPEELDKERKVIVEEINMVEDTPEDICYDEIATAMYGETGLGKTILGPVENVLSFKKADVDGFVSEYYSPKNTVITFSGNITEEQADRLVKSYVLPRYKSAYSETADEKDCFKSRVYRERIKDFEQSNIALAFPSVSFSDKAFTAQAALNVIVGGGMSSRLFQSIREQKGLAYSVFSSPSAYKNIGSFNIYLNISKVNTQKAVEAVKRELDELKKNGITDDELDRTKVQLKSGLVFAGESVQSIMNSCGKQLLLSGKAYDIDERIAEIDALTKKQIDDFAAEVFDYSKICAAYVGKAVNVDLLEIF